MTGLELRNINVEIGGNRILRDVNLSMAKGECVALLGPSGCGKTTTLRTIAGFITPQAGEVLVSGTNYVGLPPNKRNVGLVFQDYALFPHMTIFENVAYGLKMRKTPKAEIERLVMQFLEMVQLGHVKDRLPGNLSGGQRQRVALARALVISPDLLLLDEPLGALDKKLRDQMQVELKQLQKKLGVTTIIVTHDQEEALSLADRVAVMFNGEIREIGSPSTLYESPSHRDVMEFLGGSNILECRATEVTSRGATIAGPGGFRATIPSGMLAVGQHLQVGIRPEHMLIQKVQSGNQPSVRGVVHETVYKGAIVEVLVRAEDGHLFLASFNASSVPESDLQSGAAICLAFDEKYLRIFSN